MQLKSSLFEVFMQNFKSALACIFILAGGFGLATAVLSLLNPLGTTRHNRGDPLGAPVPSGDAILLICIYLLLIIIGIWLAVSTRRGRQSL
jgi:hypothetical protein